MQPQVQPRQQPIVTIHRRVGDPSHRGTKMPASPAVAPAYQPSHQHSYQPSHQPSYQALALQVLVRLFVVHVALGVLKLLLPLATRAPLPLRQRLVQRQRVGDGGDLVKLRRGGNTSEG